MNSIISTGSSARPRSVRYLRIDTTGEGTVLTDVVDETLCGQPLTVWHCTHEHGRIASVPAHHGMYLASWKLH